MYNPLLHSIRGQPNHWLPILYFISLGVSNQFFAFLIVQLNFRILSLIRQQGISLCSCVVEFQNNLVQWPQPDNKRLQLKNEAANEGVVRRPLVNLNTVTLKWLMAYFSQTTYMWWNNNKASKTGMAAAVKYTKEQRCPML